MADAFTGTAQSGLDTAAYDLAVRYAFRANLVFDKMADVKSTRQSHNGATVTFTKMNDLAPATTPLSETLDIDAVAATDTPVTVTLVEYGNTVVTTALLRGTSFVPFDPTVANRIAYNAAQTIDELAYTPLITSRTNIIDNGALGGNAVLSAATVRQVYNTLAAANVPKYNGNLYWGVIHPDQSYDLRAETDMGSWRIPQEYDGGMSGGIITGEVGAFEGVKFVETTQIAESAGDYQAIFGGRECLAKAISRGDGYGDSPRTVSTNTLDRLQRFNYIGWKHLVGYAVFREESSVQVTTISAAP
jgi:N4-gp56 family major capsid protein